MCVIGMLTLIACAAPAMAADTWWNAEWPFRQRVSPYTTELAEDLVDFPVTLLLDDGVFARSRAQADGRDLRAVAPDGSLLDFEIVRWSPDGIEVNVFMPKIAAGAQNQFFDLYYGNPNAEAVPSKPHWDAHYRMVMHLNGNLDDAARGGVGATAEGKVAVGEVVRFQGDPAFLNVAPERLTGLGEQIAVAVRFRVDGGPAVQTLASGRRLDEREDWFNFGLKTPHTIHTNAASHGQRAPELNQDGIAPGEWHAAIVVYDARDHTRTICIDGTALERDSALPGPLEIQEMRIGRGVLHFDPWQFTGAMDEVRLSDVARTDAWIRAEAACLAGGVNSFYAIAASEEYGKPKPAPAPFDLLAPPDGASSRTRNGVTVHWRPSAGAVTYSVAVYAAPDASAPVTTLDAGAKTQCTIPMDLAKGRTLYWTVTAHSDAGETNAKERRKMTFYDWSTSGSMPTNAVQPALKPVRGAFADLRGYLRKRIDKSIQRYFLETPESSPAILQVLRDRDRTPVRDPLMPWAGEFAGK